jgi:uncharacterized protein (DUF1697 family)
MKWVVLLRAVNLGARNKVPMAELRRLVEETGFEDVRTYLASGNVLLDGPRGRAAVAGQLEQLVAANFGVETTAIMRTPKELETTVAAHPFGKDTSESYVAFLAARPEKAVAVGFRKEHGDPDRTVLHDADVYLKLRRGVHGAHLSVARLESLLGIPATLRNWRTVVALAELAAGA